MAKRQRCVSACPADVCELAAFFGNLSPESRRKRFFSAASIDDELMGRLCDSSDPRRSLTLVVTRLRHGKPCIVATGSYIAKDSQVAEVAFAVDDALQGHGLGTLLLERLALLAAKSGFSRFWTVVTADNVPNAQRIREIPGSRLRNVLMRTIEALPATSQSIFQLYRMQRASAAWKSEIGSPGGVVASVFQAQIGCRHRRLTRAVEHRFSDSRLLGAKMDFMERFTR